ncbi:hypothetical protein CDD80_3782 [Ophiocordyceps camponoti-rufipedis]|uniref:Chitin-binding type-2 domain-containing protein n=1 Tax=Ophiocordyceps camponoti-rufipedis TaxID=2004952 RepID=A0A2C5XVT5_9HYPO|nr:hypothetical protein CDD80_3782 [Ophiocordyceps camponoti-rufipedis]
MQPSIIISLFAALAGSAMAAPGKTVCPSGTVYDEAAGKCFLSFGAPDSSNSRRPSYGKCPDGTQRDASGICRRLLW